MFHNQNHNPFEDLMKISSANSGTEYQQEAAQDEPMNPYFAQGMNEEFAKIAAEKGIKPPAKKPAVPAGKGGKGSNPVERAKQKAKPDYSKGLQGIKDTGRKAAKEVEDAENKKLTNSLLFGKNK